MDISTSRKDFLQVCEYLQQQLHVMPLLHLTAAQGGTYAIIHTQCCTYITDMSTNVTHFTKHMTKMTGVMDSPEASIASLWEMLTSSPWWKAILITIILIVLFLLLQMLPASVTV